MKQLGLVVHHDNDYDDDDDVDEDDDDALNVPQKDEIFKFEEKKMWN